MSIFPASCPGPGSKRAGRGLPSTGKSSRRSRRSTGSSPASSWRSGGSRRISGGTSAGSRSYRRSPRSPMTDAGRAYFRKELFNALTVIDQGHIAAKNMMGSWAGAMGQNQFMPSSFLRYAVDYDGDGRRDIWGTPADIFASSANYLSKVGWRGDQTWGRRVRLPKGFDRALIGLKVRKGLRDWQGLGVRRPDGRDLPTRNLRSSILLPGGANGSAYIVYDNFHSILRVEPVQPVRDGGGHPRRPHRRPIEAELHALTPHRRSRNRKPPAWCEGRRRHRSGFIRRRVRHQRAQDSLCRAAAGRGDLQDRQALRHRRRHLPPDGRRELRRDRDRVVVRPEVSPASAPRTASSST